MEEVILVSKLDSFFQQNKLVSYRKRTLILQPNDIPSSVFYIKNGYVRVYRISEDGEELTLSILKPKDFFPLNYGMNNTANSYYLETMTPLDLWTAPQSEFVAFIKENPDVLYELTNRILVRFNGMLSRMEYMVFSNAYIKVATTLLVCSRRFGQQTADGTIIQVPLTHKDIATFIGITRETTSIEMKKLEKQGYVKRIGKLMLLKDLAKLEKELRFISNQNPQIAFSL